MKMRAGRQGFTIVELLIVVVVIAILAAIVIVGYNGIQGRARDSAAKQSASTIAKKLKTYATQNDETLPATLADVGITNTSTVTYQYWRNTTSSPNTFCATASAVGVSYHVSIGGLVVGGPCPGHTGTVPAPVQCPAGYVAVPGNSVFDTQPFCVMKYEAKNSGGVAVSTASGTPWINMGQDSARSLASAACTGCRLMSKNEWLTIAHNVMSVPSNWVLGTVGSGPMISGHSDNDPASMLAASTNDADGFFNTNDSASGSSISPRQRRTYTLTNGQVIWDFGGNAWEILDAVSDANNPVPGLPSDTFDNFTYKEWNAANMDLGAFASMTPWYANPSAASWGSVEGLGKVMSSRANINETKAVIAGGAYTTGFVNNGVFSVRFNAGTTGGGASTGFRATVSPQ